MEQMQGSCCRRRPGPLPLVVFGCALMVGLLSLAGCNSLPTFKKKSPQADPILGEVHPQNNQPYGPVPPPPTDKKTNAETTNQKTSKNDDPLVGPSDTSNAYLASITKPLPGVKPLAITEIGTPAAPGAAPGVSSSGVQQTSNSQFVVRAIPKDPAFTGNSWASQPSTSTSGASGPGQFAAQPSNFVDPQLALLKARGITQQRVDQLPEGGVRLTAMMPQPGNSSQVRTFDVTARDLPSAVQAVLQQIDQK